VNLQQHVLDKPLAIPKIKKKGRRTNPPPVAMNSRRRRREPEAALWWNWCSSVWSGVLRVQRGAQELERELK
jgi:hypothetical protein